MTRYVITVSKDVVVECEDDEALIHQASIKKILDKIRGATYEHAELNQKDLDSLGWDTTIKEVIDSKQSKLI